MSKLTLGSLFDGSGGFPLGGLLCGIELLWASEIEPFPFRLTTNSLVYILFCRALCFLYKIPPNKKHYSLHKTLKMTCYLQYLE